MAKRKRKTAAKAASAPVMVDDKAWRARDDLRTLSQAEEIRRDDGRMKAAQSEARKQMSALQKVAGGDKAARAERLKDVEL